MHGYKNTSPPLWRNSRKRAKLLERKGHREKTKACASPKVADPHFPLGEEMNWRSPMIADVSAPVTVSHQFVPAVIKTSPVPVLSRDTDLNTFCCAHPINDRVASQGQDGDLTVGWEASSASRRPLLRSVHGNAPQSRVWCDCPRGDHRLSSRQVHWVLPEVSCTCLGLPGGGSKGGAHVHGD